MRIISGKYKGRRINAPKNLPARPTTDFAKEALFNIINNNYYFEQLSVLDLFAGIGSISYEFASRGAKNITSIDSHFNSIKFIKKTAEELNLPIQPIKSDVFSYLEKTTLKYNIIFADPPYEFTVEQLTKLVSLIFERELLLEEGMLIIEHSKHNDLSENKYFSHLKKYGGSVFSFFEVS